MLPTISWQNYWETLAVITVLYYGIVCLLFFRKRQMRGFRKHEAWVSAAVTRAVSGDVAPKRLQPESSAAEPAPDTPEYLPEVRALVDELHAFFDALNVSSYTTETLLAALKTIIKKHPGVKGTVYQHTITNLLLLLAGQTGTLHLRAEQAGSVWF